MEPTTPTATPSAPSTPTPPAAPATPAPPSTPDAPSASDAFEKQFELDTPATTDAAPPSQPTQPPATPAPSPTSKKSGAQAAPKSPAAPQPPTEHEEIDGIKVPKFKSDKDFRGWGLNGYKKATQLENDLKAMQTKYSDLEQRVPKTEAEKKQLADRLTELEKRYNETLSELNFANYERSPEYKEKYEKPYVDAVNNAYQEISELTVTEEDRTQPADENGVYPTKERQATKSDFDQIYQLQLGPATKLAAKKFGPEAVSIVMAHRAKIRDAAKAAVGALNQWKESAAKRAQEQETQTIQTKQRVEGLWTQVNNDIRSKNKDLFDERPNDSAWNEEFKKGTAMADAYFSDRSNQPVEQRIIFDAHVRNRIAAFPALASENNRLKSQVSQLQKDIAALRGSDPGKPDVSNPTPPANEPDSVLDAFEKKL